MLLILPERQYKTLSIVIREIRTVSVEDWRAEDTITVSDIGVVNNTT